MKTMMIQKKQQQEELKKYQQSFRSSKNIDCPPAMSLSGL